MPTALEDIRARVDRGLGRAPADVPTLDSLKARVDRAFGRESQEMISTPEVPTLESLRTRVQAAKDLPPIPRRRPEGFDPAEQAPYEPEPPQASYTPESPVLRRKPEIRRLQPGEFIQNPDGSRSTERSITVTEQAINQGRPTNIPSIYSVGGQPREVPEDQAARFALATGEQFPAFDTIEEAVQAAQVHSDAGGRFADAVPSIEPASEAPFSELLSPADRVSPIPDDIIAEGRAIIEGIGPSAPRPTMRRPGAVAPVEVDEPQSLQGIIRSLDSRSEERERQRAELISTPRTAEEPGFFAHLGRSGERGFRSLQQLRNLYGMSLGEDPEVNIARIAELERIKRSLPASEALQKFGDAKTFDEAFEAFLDAPLDVSGNLAVESLAQFAPGLPLAAGLGMAGGAAGGSLAGPPGTAVGAALGLATGVGGTSFLIEYGHKIFESMSEAGVDLTDAAQITAAFADAEFMDQARERAIRKGVPVAVFDAISGGIAGRLLLAAPKHVAAKLAAGGGEIAIQSALGASGEAAGQLMEKGEITSPPDILAEAIAELGPGAAQVGVGVALQRRRLTRPQDAVPESTGEQAAPGVAPEPGAQDAPVASPESPGEPIPPQAQPPAAPPATQVPAGLTLSEFSEYAKARQREYIADQRAQAEITAAGGLTDHQAQLPPSHRTTPEQAKARLAELDAMEAEIDARYSEEALRQTYEAQKRAEEPPITTTTPPPATLPDDIPRTVFRGYGRSDQAEPYAGSTTPILGPGLYYAFSQEGARRFGPNVEQTEFAPKNPLVIRSDAEWRALTQEAGWPFPNPFGQPTARVEAWTEALQGVLRQRGHDAVVVYWDDTTQTDTDRFGNEIKTLRTVFGEPQAFQLDKAAPETRPAPPPAQGPAVFTSETEVQPDLPPATGEPKRVKIPATAGTATPEVTEISDPDGTVRVEQVRFPLQDDGTLGRLKFKSVSKSIESYMDAADNARNRRTLTAAQKTLAAEARKSNLAAFDAAEVELTARVETGVPAKEMVAAAIDRARPGTIPGDQQMTYGSAFQAGVAGNTRATYQDPIRQRAYAQGYQDGQAFRGSSKYQDALSGEGVVIETLTARGQRTSFTFAATEQGLENLRETAGRYGKLPIQTSYSRAPAVAGLEVPEGSPAGVERAVETEHGTARIVFPDEMHERLYDLAEGRPDKAEARALYSEFEGFVIENFRGPADVIALARDYRAEVLDQARTAAQYRGGRPEAAALVVDPEMQTEYLQRPTLASLRARVDRAMEGELPETAHAGPGAAYVGMVRDRVEGVELEVPIRREDILRPLIEDLGASLYQGRIKSKKFLGFYRRHVEEIRIKRMNDIEVASHEIAHMLDDRFSEIRHQWLPPSNANKEIRDELRGVSYDKTKLFEGFAEFVRLWSTQREEAKARAPKFYGWFEDFVAGNEHGPALRKAQEGMHQWFAQDAVSRARSKIGVTEEINAGLTRPFDKFRQGVADDLHGIYQMERQLTGTINPVGAYETARLTRGKHAIIEGTLLYGAPVVKPDGSHSFEGKGLSQILDPVAERLDDFLMYAVGRSAGELMSQGREHLFTGAEIKGMRALETPEFHKAFNEYQVWNRAILDFAEAKGVINPFFRATWKRAQYLPFHRVGQPGAFSPVPGDWKGIRALTGGTDNLRDILGNMIGNASTLIDAALTNEARFEVARLSQLRGGAKFMAKIPTDERITKVHRDEIERAILEALGVKQKAQLPIEQQKFIDQIVQNMGPMVPLLQRGQSPYGNNVVAVLRKGKPEYYEVADPLLYRALTHLNRPSKGALLRLLSGFRRVGQLTITLTPDFLIANIARDTISGAIMSRHGFKPFKDSVVGLISRLKSDPNYRDFIANGGGFSSYYTEEAAFKKHLKRFYARKGINFKNVLDSPSKFFYAVERIADAFEMATRLGEYRKAIRKGEHPRHAAYSGREVSTDFAMRGDWAPIGYAYDSIIFTKAAVNGLDRSYRGVAHDQNRVAIAGRIAALAMVSAGLATMWRGIPDYDDMEDWDRDGHWHFFIPKPETIQAWADGRTLPPIEDRYEHFRYPKIWEIGAISSIAERTITRVLDDEAGELPKDFGRILLDTFRVEYMPQIIAPVFEAGVPFTEFKGINRRRFFDRPIQDARLQQLQPWARSSPYTSTTLRKLGEATRKLPRGGQVVPVQVEALLRGYFNTFALYGLQLSDAVFFDDTPDIPVDRYPVIRRFYERSPLRRTKYLNEFYEMLNLATEAQRTMREMDRTYRPEFAEEIERSPENLEYRQLMNANKEMRGIVSEIRSVMRAPTLAALHELAEEMARRASYRPTISKLRFSKDWRDLGALKAGLLDMTILERNKHAKTIVQDIEAQRREGLGVITIRPGQ